MIDDRTQTAAFFFFIWKESVKDALIPNPHDPKLSFEQAPAFTREVFFIAADKFNAKMNTPHNRYLLARELHRFWARMSLYTQNITTRTHADLMTFTKMEWFWASDMMKDLCRKHAQNLFDLQKPRRNAA